MDSTEAGKAPRACPLFSPETFLRTGNSLVKENAVFLACGVLSVVGKADRGQIELSQHGQMEPYQPAQSGHGGMTLARRRGTIFAPN